LGLTCCCWKVAFLTFLIFDLAILVGSYNLS
jgi:hypothetical protein